MDFAPLFAERDSPAKSLPHMGALLLLKQLVNLSDEHVDEEWQQNHYFHAICGMETFHWKFPCGFIDFCHFRKHIRERGMWKILEISMEIHWKQRLFQKRSTHASGFGFGINSKKLRLMLKKWTWFLFSDGDDCGCPPYFLGYFKYRQDTVFLFWRPCAAYCACAELVGLVIPHKCGLGKRGCRVLQKMG